MPECADSWTAASAWEDPGMDWKLEVVVLPVADVEGAKEFYVDRLGFGLDVDNQISDSFRIVQVTPPGSACSITFGTGMSGAEPGSVKGLQLVVSDIDEAAAQLNDHGVENSGIKHFDNGVQQPGKGGPWNSFLFFDDPDGNSWAIQEKPADA